MKFIDEELIADKKVILRCDYNVPCDNDVITDNSRIVKSLITINYLLQQNCSIIILSHMGRIKNKEDKLDNSLRLVAEELSRLINKKVDFVDDPVGMKVLNKCKNLKSGEVILLENTRFCDVPEKLESKNDLGLSEYWASLADVFVVDAFGSLHRAHASVAGISRFLPTYLGLLVKEELVGLDPVTKNTAKPFGVFMGGGKVDDKIKYIKNILPKCDYLFLGGGIANSFLLASGYDIGNSLATSDENLLNELKWLLEEYKDKIVLPIDFVIDNNSIFDLGIKTINKYKKFLERCKTIFINGTCGKFEDEKYSNGTKTLFESLNNIDAYIAAGGGDTLSAIKQFGFSNTFDFLSSGGGASLEYISANKLEALSFIEENNS